MNKVENFKHYFEQAIYILACIASFGLVYLIRIIITQGLLMALWRRDYFIEEAKFEKCKEDVIKIIDTAEKDANQ